MILHHTLAACSFSLHWKREGRMRILSGNPNWSTVSLLFCTFSALCISVYILKLFYKLSSDCSQNTILGLNINQIMTIFKDHAVSFPKCQLALICNVI